MSVSTSGTFGGGSSHFWIHHLARSLASSADLETSSFSWGAHYLSLMLIVIKVFRGECASDKCRSDSNRENRLKALSVVVLEPEKHVAKLAMTHKFGNSCLLYKKTFYHNCAASRPQ